MRPPVRDDFASPRSFGLTLRSIDRRQDITLERPIARARTKTVDHFGEVRSSQRGTRSSLVLSLFWAERFSVPTASSGETEKRSVLRRSAAFERFTREGNRRRAARVTTAKPKRLRRRRSLAGIGRKPESIKRHLDNVAAGRTGDQPSAEFADNSLPAEGVRKPTRLKNSKRWPKKWKIPHRKKLLTVVEPHADRARKKLTTAKPDNLRLIRSTAAFGGRTSGLRGTAETSLLRRIPITQVTAKKQAAK